MGTKADDHNGCDACSECHAALDNLRGPKLYQQALKRFDQARLETIVNRIERGILK